VDYAAEVKEEWLEKAEVIGVTSGASVPEILVNDLLKFLDMHGYNDVQEVKATEETLLFALPKELRKDLNKA
jgi:4-hydroxy-3-methylbut-2-enyl diphosphate reductase